MLAGEHADFGIGAVFEAKDLVSLGFVFGAGSGLDKAGGLADVLETEERAGDYGDRKQYGEGFGDFALFADNEETEINCKNCD